MSRSRVGLVGRAAECAVLAQTIAAVRGGESRVLVLHGAPGVGKSALLDHLDGAATGLQVLRAAGVESEMELAFATLHQLCVPVLDLVRDLPVPQRDALETVFGIRAGTPPERFLVGLAVLSLLSNASERRPTLCLVDDAQWMDRASAQILEFVARRLLAESVAMVFATREQTRDLLGLPELEVTGLAREDAHALLRSASHARLDQHVRDRIVAETRGNPLALLEFSRQVSAPRTADGPGMVDAGTLSGRLEQSFLTRIERLSEQSRLLLLIAAAEPVGDPTLVWRAAERLGVTPTTALDDEIDGLLSFEVRVIFRHPLVRSAVYRTVRDEERRAAHRALAEVTDPRLDPDRRAWHLASAAAGPDEAVAAELERCAGRAQARGGLVAAAAFLQRSVALSVDTTRRAERAVAAAAASLRAGDLAAARSSVDIAERHAQDDFQRVRADLVRSHIAFAAGLGDDAPPLLLAAAGRLEPFDMDLARETYLIAWGAAALVAADSGSLMAISRAMKALPPLHRAPRPIDLVLAGYALIVTDGWAAAVPVLRRAAVALVDLPARDLLKWGWVSNGVTAAVWDDRAMRQAYDRAVEVARNAGALTELPIHLAALGIVTTWAGDFATAAAVVAEAEAVAAATGVPLAPHAKLHLAAMRGREVEASTLITTTLEGAGADGQMMGVTAANWAAAVLYNGLARHEQVIPAARVNNRIAALWVSVWVLPELVEAAVRVGDDAIAREALDRLADAAEPYDTDWARGILARSRALLSDGSAADHLYREAIGRLGRTSLRTELARAHLLYGEWLRRQSRRVDARLQLRTAYDMFASIGMDAFAERARRELLATGAKAQKRTADASASDTLTPQERQIALLVRDGFSNPEVSALLFLSPKTVEWHLSKIFAKLSITSRRQLRDALPGSD